MQAGDVSAPVKTDSGWHVLQLREIKTGRQVPFEQAREELAREQGTVERERAFNDLTGKLVDQVYKNPSSLAPAARAVGLPVQKVGPFARGAGDGHRGQRGRAARGVFGNADPGRHGQRSDRDRAEPQRVDPRRRALAGARAAAVAGRCARGRRDPRRSRDEGGHRRRGRDGRAHCARAKRCRRWPRRAA